MKTKTSEVYELDGMKLEVWKNESDPHPFYAFSYGDIKFGMWDEEMERFVVLLKACGALKEVLNG